MNWLDILRAETEKKGRKQVANELDIGRSSLGLALTGKYPGSTDRLKEKVLRTYGSRNTVDCPVLDEITVIACRENCRNAKKYGHKATGNPVTLKLYATCPTCPNRSI